MDTTNQDVVKKKSAKGLITVKSVKKESMTFHERVRMALNFKEWKGSGSRTLTIISVGIMVVFLSTVLIGIGSCLVSIGI